MHPQIIWTSDAGMLDDPLYVRYMNRLRQGLEKPLRKIRGGAGSSLYVSTENAPIGGNGTAFTAAAASSMLLGTSGGEPVIKANTLYVGKLYRLKAFGQIGNVVTSQPTIKFGVLYGGNAGVVLCQTAALQVTATATTSLPWFIEAMFQVTTLGATGTITATGLTFLGTDATSPPPPRFMTATGGNVSVTTATVDTTADKAISLVATWSATNAANTGNLLGASLEALN